MSTIFMPPNILKGKRNYKIRDACRFGSTFSNRLDWLEIYGGNSSTLFCLFCDHSPKIGSPIPNPLALIRIRHAWRVESRRLIEMVGGLWAHA